MSDNLLPKAIVYLDQNYINNNQHRFNHNEVLYHLRMQYDVIKIKGYVTADLSDKKQYNAVRNLWKTGISCSMLNKTFYANVITHLVTDMCYDRYLFDHKAVILVSGDQDYSYPLQTLSNAGYIIHVCGYKDSMADMLSERRYKITYIEDIPNIELQQRMSKENDRKEEEEEYIRKQEAYDEEIRRRESENDDEEYWENKKELEEYWEKKKKLEEYEENRRRIREEEDEEDRRRREREDEDEEEDRKRREREEIDEMYRSLKEDAEDRRRR